MAARASRGLFHTLAQSDLAYSFLQSRIAVAAAVITITLVLAALLAPWIAPHTPFDVATISLMDSEIPPIWSEGGDARFLLGTDYLGRDVLSTIMYGLRLSLLVGFASVILGMALGIPLGLASGYFGGMLDAFIMRLADVMLSFPAILIALLVDGVARVLLPRELHHEMAVYVVIFSITMATWVHYARTARSCTMVENTQEYVQAARVIGVHPLLIMFRHIAPNIMGPILVIATINLAIAVLTEATLSFLGVGLPPTEPSLGTLIRIGNDYLFSGFWWITVFPSLTLVILVLSVNLLGDWMRDAFNPKLRMM